MTTAPARTSAPWRRLATGVAGLVAGAVALSGCSVYEIPLPGGADVGDDPITVKANFRDVLDLVPQSTVKVNDVTVGRVGEVKLTGYTAQLELILPNDVDLPDNARAEIRQTSLLGEKFVSLSAPASPSSGRLGNGDVIGLGSTGRNPEVEEVLSALGAMLSGGGVGQLKTIAEELNTAMGGREDEFRSVLTQIRTFSGQLDQNKSSIIAAIENLNRLAIQLRREDPAIKSALDNLPAALSSIDKQRDDLVKMLRALNRLSGVGVRTIQASKESTINSLRHLAPVLTAFADAGQDFPKSFQVFLTYPFVDEAVGRDPQVARNLHMGDYTNLSMRLNLDLRGGGGAPTVPEPVVQGCKQARAELRKESDAAVERTPGLTRAQKDRLKTEMRKRINGLDCEALGRFDVQGVVRSLANALLDGVVDLPDVEVPDTGGIIPDGVGLGRAGLGSSYQVDPRDPLNLRANGFDPGIGTLLLQGLLAHDGGAR